MSHSDSSHAEMAADDQKPIGPAPSTPGEASDAKVKATTAAPAQTPASHLLAHIASLRAQQELAREERLKLAKELKNATRRKRRLQRKARQLSNAELLQVLEMRGAKYPAMPEPTAEATDEPPEGNPKAAKVSVQADASEK